MPGKQEDVEVNNGGGDPFGDEARPAVQYVIDRWKYHGDDLVIEGNITSMSVTFELKRPKYQSDNIYGQEEISFNKHKCDIIVPKAKAEIMSTGDDVAIAGYVFARLAQELGVQMRQVSLYHMDKAYPKPEEKDARVSAGEGRETTKKTVEF